MSWEKDEATRTVTFFCDGIERGSECLHHSTYTAREALTHGSIFAACWHQAEAEGWRSFKKRGRDWEYFCKECVPDAEEAQRRYNDEERERERIKERNARYFE